jgi:cation transport ATPase
VALAATAQRESIIKGGAKLEGIGSVDSIVFEKNRNIEERKVCGDALKVIGTSKSWQKMLELLALVQEQLSHLVSTPLFQTARVSKSLITYC